MSANPPGGSLLQDLQQGITIITGCDTDVGKTVAAAVCTGWLIANGHTPEVVKPTQTGLTKTEPGDLADIARLSGLDVCHTHEYSRLPEPLAPTTAARRAGIELPSVSEVAEKILTLQPKENPVLVEGAGGLLVGLDSQGFGLLELADALGKSAPDIEIRFVVVAHPGLGTLNTTLLTCRAIRNAGHKVHSVIFGTWPDEPDLACRCNEAEIADLVQAPLLMKIPSGIGSGGQQFARFIESI